MPEYSVNVLGLVVDPGVDDDLVTVTLGRLGGTAEIVQARYVVGCDGAIIA